MSFIGTCMLVRGCIKGRRHDFQNGGGGGGGGAL